MYLDHIVHFIEETPQQAAEHWKRKGFHSAVGGQHEQWGTHNALLYLKDCYIEWLAVEKPEVALKADHPLTELLLHDQKGFGTICLRTDDISKMDERLKNEGFETSGILDAQRKTENGDSIQWKMLFIIEKVSDELPYPFFIEWQESDEKRYAGLRKRNAIQPANEKFELESLVFGVHNPEQSRLKWARLLGTSLDLPNCRIEFKETGEQRERLEELVFRGGNAAEVYQQGVYCLPEQGNIG